MQLCMAVRHVSLGRNVLTGADAHEENIIQAEQIKHLFEEELMTPDE